MAKCLSLKQPYAELIVSSRKTIEIRKWNTKFRGQFLIHASKTINSESCKVYNIDVSSLITGAIVGSALLQDVKLYQSKAEFLADQSKHFAVSAYSEPCMDSCSTMLKDLIIQFLLRGVLVFLM